MKEIFLHHVWESLLFDQNQLKTTCGKDIRILKPGRPHHDAGPDFQLAILLIDGTKWAGDVEIHLSSADWHKHGHSTDSRYDQTILHVVYTNNGAPILRSDKTQIPCLELKPYISYEVLHKYAQLQNATNAIPCSFGLEQVPKLIWEGWTERLAIDRLESKVERLKPKLAKLQNNWLSLLYWEIARCMGLTKNTVGFELLAKKIPLSIVLRQSNIEAVEALFFGVSGLLPAHADSPYEEMLHERFTHLQHKYAMETLDNSVWVFLRIRPHEFPTIRIAQLAHLARDIEAIFEACCYDTKLKDVMRLLQVQASPFWETHFSFNNRTSPHTRQLGTSKAQQLVSNAIIPVLFGYAQTLSNEALSNKLVEWSHELPPEKNNVTGLFASKALPNANGFQSQGILQLHQKFCTLKRCLECAVGHSILKKKTDEKTICKNMEVYH